MRHREPLLVILLKLIDGIPWPQESAQRRRGRPTMYSERLIVKTLVIMINRAIQWSPQKHLRMGGQVPVKGRRRPQFIVLGAVYLHQVGLLYQLQHQRPAGVGFKPLLRAAC